MTTFCVLHRLQCYHSLRINLKHFVIRFQKLSTKKEERTKDEVKKQNELRMREFKSCHIKDPKVADLVIANMNLSKETNDTTIMEANPGPGVLSKKLLKIPYFKKLILFEQRKQFHPKLEILNETQEDRLVLIPEDFFLISKLFSNSLRIGNSKTYKMLSTIEPKDLKDWNNGPLLKVIGFIHPTKESKFLRYLCAKLPYFDSIFSHGRCELYFFISEREYLYMISKAREKLRLYTGASVLFQLFFDIELIDKVPNSAFEPKILRKSPSKMEIYKYDKNVTCFVKMVPKENITELTSDGYLPDLYYFVKQNMVNRNLFVVASLEKWIPDCGPRLIKNGLSIFTKFGELSPQEILHIFNQFSS